VIGVGNFWGEVPEIAEAGSRSPTSWVRCGRRLLEDALRRDRDQDTVFQIEVRADNEPALGLYEDLGFVEIGSTTSETASGTATFLKLRLEPLESPGGTSLETTR